MRTHAGFLSHFIIVVSISIVHAADGIVVTGPKGKYMHSFGSKLIAYTITNNKLAGEKTFVETSIKSQPAVNMSGTHVAFMRAHNNATWISITPIDGGDIYDIHKVADDNVHGDVWWLQSGDIVYYYDCQFHKVKFDWKADATAVSYEIYAKFKCKPQGYYIGLSTLGDKASWRVYKGGCFGNDCGSTSSRGIIPTGGSEIPWIGPGVAGFEQACGCGNGVSASGEWTCCLQGSGHGSIGIHRWDGSDKYSVRYSTINSWTGDHVGPGGDANRFAVNSDRWIATIAGVDGRFLREGSDCVLFNIDTTKSLAINVTNNKGASSNTYAFVGSFWLSSKADVNPELWTFVENRDTWKANWDDALQGKPVSIERRSTSVKSFNALRPTINLCSNILSVEFAQARARKIRAFDMLGRLKAEKISNAKAVSFAIPQIASQVLFIEIIDDDAKQVFKISN